MLPAEISGIDVGETLAMEEFGDGLVLFGDTRGFRDGGLESEDGGLLGDDEFALGGEQVGCRVVLSQEHHDLVLLDVLLLVDFLDDDRLSVEELSVD